MSSGREMSWTFLDWWPRFQERRCRYDVTLQVVPYVGAGDGQHVMHDNVIDWKWRTWKWRQGAKLQENKLSF